jgi:hypothetical protein
MTPVNSSDMLSRLGSGIRPGPVNPSSASTPIEQAAFADLLGKAKAGAVASGLPVEIDRALGLSLTEAQMTRLSQAADRAESAGIQRAMIMIDGMALLMDVKTRTVTGNANLAAGPVPGIDGVVSAGSGGDEPAQVLPVPAGASSNASLSALLAKLRSDQAGASAA